MAQEFDYHFMVLAPGLQSAWFFQAARLYWQRFQPVVTDDLVILGYPPSGARMIVTVLARTDTADYIQGAIAEQRPDAVIDLVVTDDLTTMESTLNERAELGLPFG